METLREGKEGGKIEEDMKRKNGRNEGRKEGS